MFIGLGAAGRLPFAAGGIAAIVNVPFGGGALPHMADNLMAGEGNLSDARDQILTWWQHEAR